ncbi:MAG: hypothetical protein Kow0031_23060 [Anaerolineae bacterium]
MPFPARAQTPEPPPIPLGFHLARGDSEHFEAARAAGGEFAVVVFSWDNIEPEPGYHYWSDTDAALSAAEYYGLEVIARLDQPPAWAIRPGENPPFNTEAYAAFAGRVAQRYGPRLAGIILWNEPNLSLEWNDQPPDAAGYVALLKPAYAAVKAVAPDVPVALAAPASTEGEGDWAINDLDYLQAVYAAGARDYFDVLTAHPYGFGRPPDDAPEKYRPNFRRLELYHDLMAANDDAAKPVWVTEAGWLVETGDPKSEWQLVSPQTQAAYILGALDYARQNYPWLERLALWQLNAQGDEYGFNLWNGPDSASPAFRALVESCPARSDGCNPAAPTLPIGLIRSPLFILAPDSTIRLGDRDTLHPHWVHLYRNGSLSWSGEFFVSEQEANLPYHLLLETMQVTQPGNRLLLNGQEVGRLAQRPRPDITSTWVTQKFSLPPGALRPGPNTLTLVVGPRNPLRQYNTARFENVQMRHARLELAEAAPKPLFDGWQPRPSPGGWTETARLHPAPGGNLWLTGNRPGQLWQLAPTPPFSLTQQAGNRPDVTFTDVLSLPAAQLAATDEGLLWRADAAAPWRPVTAPAAHAYAVAQFDGQLWAAFEGEGLWSSPAITGPWTRSPLTAATVIDLLPAPDGPLFAAAPEAIFASEGSSGAWQSLPLPGLTTAELIDNGEFYGDKMRPRLTLGNDGSLLVRVDDRLWVAKGAGVGSQESGESRPATLAVTPTFTIHHSPFTIQNWLPFGPEELAGRLYSVTDCCGPGTIVGTNKEGLWRLDEAGAWRRLDDGTFSVADVTELWRGGDTLLAAGETGLFASIDGGQTWQVTPGLPTPVSTLLVDPAEPARWVAGTPTGVYLSRDAGDTWQPVSPPWTVWDMAFGPTGRLFVARSNGLAFVDDLSGAEIPWQESDDMGRVFFLRVRPNPGQPQQVWSGTWGNNIAASDDGGASVRPIHNGLETLSGLDLLWHATPGQVTLATIEGLYRTDDGGQSWFRLPGPLENQTVHSLLQTEDGAIWAGAADGLWRSADFGVTWQRVEAVPAAAVVRLGRLDNSAGWLWAGAEGAGLWLSRDGGQTWAFGGLAERTVYSLLLNPARPGELVAATDAGIRVAETKGSQGAE